MTNYEKLQQGSYNDWLNFQDMLACETCIYYEENDPAARYCHMPKDKTCRDGRIAWLNQEVEDDTGRD